MQQKTNEAIDKIANIESDEEASAQFQGLIKMIRPKKLKIAMKKKRNNRTIERKRTINGL